MAYKAKHVDVGKKNRRRISRKAIAFCAAFVLAVSGAVGGVAAWLTAGDDPVTNTFEPAEVSCEVRETFDEDTGVKTDVRVANTSNIPVYIRVRLVGNQTGPDGAILAGGSFQPPVTQGSHWMRIGDYYYYTVPVAAKTGDAAPETGNLIDSVTLSAGQTLDVLAEAIQSEPDRAVEEAWGVAVDDATGVITGEAMAN